MKRPMRNSGLLVLVLLLWPAVAAAQDTTRLPPGVMLETRYSKAGRQILAVRAFEASPELADVATQVASVIRNDLTLSDRFQMAFVPQELMSGEVDYVQWNGLNVVWLVTGTLLSTGSGYQLDIALHDVVYGNVRQRQTFPLPAAVHSDFRMAAHIVSDEIVRWITNQPGMATTRIAFVRQNPGGSYDLMIVDSDGENLRRISGSSGLIYSPTWSADGTRLAYTTRTDEDHRLVERDMATGATRVLRTARTDEMLMTPSYIPSSTKIAYASWVNRGVAIHEFDYGENCCVKKLTDSRGDNVSPTYSPDGRRFAFHSSRTGRQHIFVAAADGGGVVTLTPFGERVEYAAPDWQPTGTRVVFHGESRGTKQLLVADAARPGSQIQQLTSTGHNEDPSWAPDGRHIVYSYQAGLSAASSSLYVIDTVTGENRLLVSGGSGAGLRLADWSPSLVGTVTVVQTH